MYIIMYLGTACIQCGWNFTLYQIIWTIFVRSSQILPLFILFYKNLLKMWLGTKLHFSPQNVLPEFDLTVFAHQYIIHRTFPIKLILTKTVHFIVSKCSKSKSHLGTAGGSRSTDLPSVLAQDTGVLIKSGQVLMEKMT